MRILGPVGVLVAALLLTVGPTPQGQAQESLFRVTRVLEANFAYTEALRLSGHCDEWRKQREHLYWLTALGLALGAREGMTREAIDYHARRQDAKQRTCTPAARPGPLPLPPREQDRNLGDLNMAQAFDGSLATASTARAAGDCERNRSELSVAQAILDRMPRNDTAEQRLREAQREQCVPRQPPVASAPSEPCAVSFNDQLASGRGTRCRCSGVYERLMTWGANPYRGDSPICNAAAHAGVLPPEGIGEVSFVLVGLQQPMLGTSRNGISTYNWDYNFAPAFTFEGAAPGGGQ